MPTGEITVHLVDGTYELFRAFFGAPRRGNRAGLEVGATLGLLRSLRMLVDKDAATHVGVAFDTVIESFRNTLFAGYKTGDGIEPDLLRQFPLAEDAARQAGLTVWSMVDFEADDALATAAHRFADDERVKQVVIASPDKDLMQCVRGDRVVTWDRRRGVVYDEAGVVEKFGIRPESIPDYLALVGDAADGIPGIPKWGAKAAAAALSAVGHVDAIPFDPAAWAFSVRGKAGLSATLEAGRDDVRLYRTLATLRTDVPLEETLDDLRWRPEATLSLDDLEARLGL